MIFRFAYSHIQKYGKPNVANYDRWPYLRNGLSDPLHVWFYGGVFEVGGSNGAISGRVKFTISDSSRLYAAISRNLNMPPIRAQAAVMYFMATSYVNVKKVSLWPPELDQCSLYLSECQNTNATVPGSVPHGPSTFRTI